MAMEIMNNYGSYAAQSLSGSSAAGGAKTKNAEQTDKKTGTGKSESTADYINKLAKLAPSVEFRIGNTFASDKSGKTLTVHPKLLEKMQNDPETEKEMKELIQGVESAVNLFDNINQTTGWTVVFKHSYIDENGKYRQIALVRNDFMLNMSDKLREERRENSEKLIEKSKEKTAEEKAELQESLENKKEDEKEAQPEEASALNKAEQLLYEKIENSKDGMFYLYDTDMKTIMEALKKENTGSITDADKQVQAGANLDLQI